jgi:hypothetical protein
MSAVLEPTAAPTTPNAVEYVRALSPDDQEAVFLYLLKELIRINGGNGLIPISSDTEQLGYYVPPKAADHLFEKYGPKLTPEREAEIAERIARNEPGIPIREMIDDLNREAEAIRAGELQRQSA